MASSTAIVKHIHSYIIAGVCPYNNYIKVATKSNTMHGAYIIHNDQLKGKSRCLGDFNHYRHCSRSEEYFLTGTDPGGWMGWLATLHEWPCNYSDVQIKSLQL